MVPFIVLIALFGFFYLLGSVGLPTQLNWLTSLRLAGVLYTDGKMDPPPPRARRVWPARAREREREMRESEGRV
jgi:hypothetical protein